MKKVQGIVLGLTGLILVLAAGAGIILPPTGRSRLW